MANKETLKKILESIKFSSPKDYYTAEFNKCSVEKEQSMPSSHEQVEVNEIYDIYPPFEVPNQKVAKDCAKTSFISDFSVKFQGYQ